jgi:hypothetical protein
MPAACGLEQRICVCRFSVRHRALDPRGARAPDNDEGLLLMKIKVAAATALAGMLLFAASQAVTAAPLVNLKDTVQVPARSVDLVRQGGRSGFGGVKGGGGGKGFSGLPSGGYKGSAMRSGGGPKGSVYRGGGGKGWARGSGKGYAGKAPGKVYGGKGPRGGDWARGGNRGAYAYRGGKGYKYRDRSRYIYPGVGLGLAYGGYSYGDDCGWLYRRAQATGSPYWWQRFEECRYSYY